MLNKQLALFLFLLAGTSLSAQDSIARPPRNFVYAELGGNGFIYSINYARVFDSRHTELFHPVLRAGFSYVPHRMFNDPWSDADGVYLLPLEASVLIGKKRHYLEAGLGITFTYYKTIFSSTPHSPDYYTRYEVIGFGRLGYCFRPLKRNMLFRIAATPVLQFPDFLWAGVSAGYAF
jgi:hypothetical protein